MFVKVRELKTFFVSTNLQGIQRRQDQAEGGAIAQEDSNDINAMLLSGEWILLDTKHCNFFEGKASRFFTEKEIVGTKIGASFSVIKSKCPHLIVLAGCSNFYFYYFCAIAAWLFRVKPVFHFT